MPFDPIPDPATLLNAVFGIAAGSVVLACVVLAARLRR